MNFFVYGYLSETMKIGKEVEESLKEEKEFLSKEEYDKIFKYEFRERFLKIKKES